LSSTCRAAALLCPGALRRALYTSSVLIASIGSRSSACSCCLLAAVSVSARLEAGKSAGVGLSTWLLPAPSPPLSTNMTLMLRPRFWRKITPPRRGAYLPTGTLRLCQVADDAGRRLSSAGCGWFIWPAGRPSQPIEAVCCWLGARWQPDLALRIRGVCGASVQPTIVKAGLAGHAVYPRYELAVTPATAGWPWLWLPFCWAHAGFGKIAASWIGWAGALLACSSRSCSPSTAMASAT